MASLVTINPRGFLIGGKGAIFEDIRKRLENLQPAGPAVVEVMRQGGGSVADQFAKGQEIALSGVFKWPPTKPFGNRLAGQTLVRTGRYRAAWTGQGAGAITRITGSSFAIGVDTALFPQVRVFQARSATRIRAKKRTARGKLAMQIFLGMQYGVWISEARLLAGLVVEPRRVAIGPEMVSRASSAILQYVRFGVGGGQRRVA